MHTDTGMLDFLPRAAPWRVGQELQSHSCYQMCCCLLFLSSIYGMITNMHQMCPGGVCGDDVESLEK